MQAPCCRLRWACAHSAPTRGIDACVQAWEHGLASDSDPEWRARLEQLRAYHRRHGDCSVGCREGDDRELARCAGCRQQRLIGHPLAPQAALRRRASWHLPATPPPLLFASWATKQRTQRSRGELHSDKEEQLVSLGFEFDEDEAEWLRWFLDLARCVWRNCGQRHLLKGGVHSGGRCTL